MGVVVLWDGVPPPLVPALGQPGGKGVLGGVLSWVPLLPRSPLGRRCEVGSLGGVPSRDPFLPLGGSLLTLEGNGCFWGILSGDPPTSWVVGPTPSFPLGVPRASFLVCLRGSLIGFCVGDRPSAPPVRCGSPFVGAMERSRGGPLVKDEGKDEEAEPTIRTRRGIIRRRKRW